MSEVTFGSMSLNAVKQTLNLRKIEGTRQGIRCAVTHPWR